MRTLKEKEALILFKKLLRLPDEAINEAAPLMIYYTEFRKDSFKDWKWSAPGLYDDIKVFNDPTFNYEVQHRRFAKHRKEWKS